MSVVGSSEKQRFAQHRESQMNQYRFCPMCGKELGMSPTEAQWVVACHGCGFRASPKPAVGVGVIVLEGELIIMGRRGSRGGPRYKGAWCIPCGYLEWGEDVRDAARREFLEETGLEVDIRGVYAVHSNFHNPKSLTVGIWFSGDVVGGSMQAGDDLDSVGYFPLGAIPEPLAFPTDRLVLEQLRGEILRPPLRV